MCVIAFSPKGVNIPSVEQITEMWRANPDGAGYAFVGKNGDVFYRKGFMTLEDLLKELDKPEKFKSTNFAIHFRIGTSGKNDGHTCHPFPISTDFGELRRMEGKAKSVLFHNGIIGKGGLADPLSSDTQDFVIAMAPMLEKFNRSKTRDNLIEEIVKGNRILALYKNGAVKMYGDWAKDGDIWVSNLNYKYTYHSYYYGYDDDDYELNKYAKMMKSENDEYWEKQLGPGEDDKALAFRTVADKLFSEIIAKEYKFMSPQEIDELKTYADDVDGELMEYAGYLFGYDYEQGIVWLEEDTLYEAPDPKETEEETEDGSEAVEAITTEKEDE